MSRALHNSITYEGPCLMDCPERCEVPAGGKLAVVPPSRHAWNDIARCPNEGCGLTFLILAVPAALSGSVATAEEKP